MPKKGSMPSGSYKRKDVMKDFITDTKKYIERYHVRSNSEAGFLADKKIGWGMPRGRMTGWIIRYSVLTYGIIYLTTEGRQE